MHDESETIVADYGKEIESAIFTLVISLVTHRASKVGYPKARQETAQHLETLSKALRELE
jgi:hypothetical protein